MAAIGPEIFVALSRDMAEFLESKGRGRGEWDEQLAEETRRSIDRVKSVLRFGTRGAATRASTAATGRAD